MLTTLFVGLMLGAQKVGGVDRETEDVRSTATFLEQYLLSQGREWERYAWLKGRALTGARARDLEELVRPFVFRKYLDYDAYANMRGLHKQIRAEVTRRELHNDVKLGPGGIREVEFIAQVFQLIRGGRDRDLQTRSTRAALRLLGERGQLPQPVVAELQEVSGVSEYGRPAPCWRPFRRA